MTSGIEEDPVETAAWEALKSPDLGYSGDAMDQWIEDGHVVAFRRHGPVITFGINNTVTALNADQAEFIARQLFAASVAARHAGEVGRG